MKNLTPQELLELLKIKVQKVMVINVNKYNKIDDIKRIDRTRDLDYEDVCKQTDTLYQKFNLLNGILQLTISDEIIIYIHRYGPMDHFFGKLEEK